MTARRPDEDRGSTLPLILGFFVVAFVVVAGSIALAQAFVQQRDLQDTCDGAAAAAVASSADLDRSQSVAGAGSLQFIDVDPAVTEYLQRDRTRAAVRVRAQLSDGGRRVTLTCRQTRRLALGAFFDRGTITHVVTSSARADVTG